MKAGLTTRGFYRRFKSQDDRFVRSLGPGIDQLGKGTMAVARSAPEGQVFGAIIERQLSAGHANSPGRRNTGEVQVVVPQLWRFADDGPGYFRTSKARAEVDGGGELFCKELR